jgi:hypothetical protein
MELEIAAARTDSISNVPAFLTEHLRRRLLGKSDVRTGKTTSRLRANGKEPQIGRTDNLPETGAEIYRAEPLTERARETVLKTMREYIGKGEREFVMSLRDTYTAEDWKWLSKNLSDGNDKKMETSDSRKSEKSKT